MERRIWEIPFCIMLLSLYLLIIGQQSIYDLEFEILRENTRTVIWITNFVLSILYLKSSREFFLIISNPNYFIFIQVLNYAVSILSIFYLMDYLDTSIHYFITVVFVYMWEAISSIYNSKRNIFVASCMFISYICLLRF